MAINRLMIEWIMDLESEHKIFSESKSIVELGPSDFMPAALKLLHKAKPNSEFEKTSVREWYASLGPTEYVAFDIVDDTRSRKADLSKVLDVHETWDIVVNFGTTEHIFNQFAAMSNIHNFAKKGGIMLHVVPMSSGLNHGFYNYHPRFFLSLALANNYEIIDFRFVPFQYHQAEVSGRKPFSISVVKRPLHIKYDLLLFFAKIRLLLRLKSIICLPSLIRTYKSFFGGDYIYLALRKLASNEFTEPVQMNHEPMKRSDVVLDNS